MTMHRSTFAALFLLGSCAALTAALDLRQPAVRAKEVPRLLPGMQSSGFVQLPNQWSLRPAGRQLELGDFPVNLALHPSGRWLAALHAGYGEHEVIIVTLHPKRQKIVCRVPIEQAFYGLCFSPDGKALYASGGELEVVHVFDFADGLLAGHKEIAVEAINDRFVCGGIAVDPTGNTLYAAGPWGDKLSIVPLKKPTERTSITFDQGSYPYACLVEP